jgi:hypothetical protein
MPGSLGLAHRNGTKHRDSEKADELEAQNANNPVPDYLPVVHDPRHVFDLARTHGSRVEDLQTTVLEFSLSRAVLPALAAEYS